MPLPKPLAFVWVLAIFMPTAKGEDARRELEPAITASFEQLAGGETVSTVPASLLEAEPRRALELLKPYENDASPKVRHYAYTLAWQVGRSSADPKVRKAVTARLTGALTDASPLVWQHAAQHLNSFDAADFTPTCHQVIRGLVNRDDVDPDVIRVVGIAGMSDLLDHLQVALRDESKFTSASLGGRWYGTRSWSARLARARLGVKGDIDRVVELVGLEPDPITRVTVLLGDLGYVRQPQTLDVIRSYLESDDRLPNASKPQNPGTQYAQYAADVLADHLADFPIDKRFVGGYSEEDLKLIRQWMRRK